MSHNLYLALTQSTKKKESTHTAAPYLIVGSIHEFQGKVLHSPRVTWTDLLTYLLNSLFAPAIGVPCRRPAPPACLGAGRTYIVPPLYWTHCEWNTVL